MANFERRAAKVRMMNAHPFTPSNQVSYLSTLLIEVAISVILVSAFRLMALVPSLRETQLTYHSA